MKCLSFITPAFLLLPCLVQAQSSNPFKSIGKEAEMLTLSNGRYQETFDDDTLQRIGSVVINSRTNQIIQLLDADSLSNETTDNSTASRWYSIDPLAEKYVSYSPYNFVLNNPIIYIDPDGREVKMSFIRHAQRLEIIDMDQYKSGLPTLYVTAAEYKVDGIRNNKGELINNQILVINNVFTGGISEDGSVERNPKQPKQKPLSEGKYDVVDNDADTKHKGWFRLDKQDSERYNDKEDATGRDGFRFHLGSESWGCVTVNKAAGDRTQEWNVIQTIFNATSTSTVKDHRGRQGLNPFSWLTRYGTLEVVGKDNIPLKQEDK